MLAIQGKPPSDTSEAPESGVVSRSSIPETVRDPIVAPPSRWARFWALVDNFFRHVAELWREPTLSDRLPPIPQPGQSDSGELLLINILRAPPAYQRATLLVARYGVELRRLGDNAYAEGLVHFVLSRMRADNDGRIPLVRLRDILSGVPVSGVLVPALRRLEGHEILTLVSTSSDAPSSLGFDAIELHTPL